LYKEDFDKFEDAMTEALNFMRKAMQTSYNNFEKEQNSDSVEFKGDAE
jgi:hypothetical protein